MRTSKWWHIIFEFLFVGVRPYFFNHHGAVRNRGPWSVRLERAWRLTRNAGYSLADLPVTCSKICIFFWYVSYLFETLSWNWITSPHSAWSTTVPLQAKCRLHTLMIFFKSYSSERPFIRLNIWDLEIPSIRRFNPFLDSGESLTTVTLLDSDVNHLLLRALIIMLCLVESINIFIKDNTRRHFLNS